MTTVTNAKTWHIANWGSLGWLETGLKGISIIAGFVAFSLTTNAGSVQIVDIPHGITIAILGLMTLFVSTIILLRFSQREVTSILFSIANTLAHIGMLYFVIFTPDNSVLPFVFGIGYVLGELVKQRFLNTTGYTEMGQETSQMLMLSRGLVIIYAGLSIASLF